MWIAHGGDNSLDTSRDQGVRAGRSAALMTVWLQVQVNGCATGAIPGLFEGQHLGMLDSGVGIRALAHNLVVSIHDHSAHPRIRRRQGDSPVCEIQGPTYELFVLGTDHHAEKSESTKFCGLKGRRSPAFSPTPT